MSKRTKEKTDLEIAEDMALLGRKKRMRQSALKCLLEFGDCETLAEKIEVYNRLFGVAEAVGELSDDTRLALAKKQKRGE